MDREALRDALAMEFLRHLLSKGILPPFEFDQAGRDAYRFADAALDAREAQKRKEAA
jgi:hypothetical protein